MMSSNAFGKGTADSDSKTIDAILKQDTLRDPLSISTIDGERWMLQLHRLKEAAHHAHIKHIETLKRGSVVGRKCFENKTSEEKQTSTKSQHPKHMLLTAAAKKSKLHGKQKNAGSSSSCSNSSKVLLDEKWPNLFATAIKNADFYAVKVLMNDLNELTNIKCFKNRSNHAHYSRDMHSLLEESMAVSQHLEQLLKATAEQTKALEVVTNDLQLQMQLTEHNNRVEGRLQVNASILAPRFESIIAVNGTPSSDRLIELENIILSLRLQIARLRSHKLQLLRSNELLEAQLCPSDVLDDKIYALRHSIYVLHQEQTSASTVHLSTLRNLLHAISDAEQSRKLHAEQLRELEMHLRSSRHPIRTT